MNIMLISPPLYNPSMPALAIPCLRAALENAGHRVVSKDSNVEYFDTVLSRKGMEHSLEKIKERQKAFSFLRYKPDEMDSLFDKKDFLISEVENAKQFLRNPIDFYNYEKYKHNYVILKDCLRFVSLPFYQTRITFTDFQTPYSNTSSTHILKALTDELCNPFIEFYRNNILPEINQNIPGMIGISINLQAQVIPGLTLAFMIKQLQKDIHIVIGGNHFSLIHQNLQATSSLFSLFDSIIINEGETAIVELSNCIEKGISLEHVPNLIYKDKDEIINNNIVHVEDISKLPTPCFDGLPLHLYFTPEISLPAYLSRGCYWGKCAFCCLCKSNGAKYRIRGVEKVMEDIENLSKKHGCNTIYFVDEAIPPNDMEEVADEIEKNDIHISWGIHARFEKQFNDTLCTKLANSGCKFLKFGLESASERILNLMDKGTNVKQIRDVLYSCSKAGITTIISTFFGFPTETMDEAKETIKFVLENIKDIHFAGVNEFILFKNTGIHIYPEKYKIKVIVDAGEDLAYNFKYVTDEGISNDEAIELSALFSSVLEELTPWFMNVFHAFFYSTHYKSSDLIWVTANEETRFMGEEMLKTRRVHDAKIRIDTFV